MIVVSITFIVLKSLPGNPLLKDLNTSKDVLEDLYKHYGFDKPLYVQYWVYLKKSLFLDFGSSLVFEDRSVIEIIKEGFPVSFALGIQSLFLSLSVGVLLGTITAFKSKKWQESLFLVFFSIGISTPHFLLATLFQYFFSMKIALLPAAKYDGINHSILPCISLAILPSCFIARLIKDSMSEVLEKDYIKLAKIKGLSYKRLVYKHLLKNSLLPLMGYFPPLCINIVLGSFVIEKIFGIPGIGSYLVTSILSRDYPVTLGLSLFFSTLLMATIFIFDLLYSTVDPRIKIENND